MIVVNLMGEPGVGKSVTAAGIFYELSTCGVRAEIVPEVAKSFAWETPKDPYTGKALTHPIFGQQIYLLGEQNRMLQRVVGQRDVAIMDSPLILTSVYRPDDYFKSFDSLVMEQFNCYHNLNFLLDRTHQYDNDGRVHTEDESREIKNKLVQFLDDHGIIYHRFKTGPKVSHEIAEFIKKYMQEKHIP